MRLISDDGGKSAWLNGKESGVTKRPGHQRSKYGLQNKEIQLWSKWSTEDQ